MCGKSNVINGSNCSLRDYHILVPIYTISVFSNNFRNISILQYPNISTGLSKRSLHSQDHQTQHTFDNNI